MDPLSFAIAAVPFAAYLLLLGGICRSGRPLVVNGANDLVVLGLGLTGVAFVGPLALFRPEAATAELGEWVWVFLLALYWLTIVLTALLGRPSLVVYNTTAEQLRSALATTAPQLDPASRWAGDSLSLPGLGVQLHLDALRWTRTVSIVANTASQDLAGWRRLAVSLNRAMQRNPAAPTTLGIALLAGGVGLLAASCAWLAAAPGGVQLAVERLLAP
ncbi:hypothetical protein [Botrimarina sp.]|uniref:hypothetical protein n=1 Tax=Botrimarina sp. TaxID=2795802 RepID=UPI0032EEA27A